MTHLQLIWNEYADKRSCPKDACSKTQFRRHVKYRDMTRVGCGAVEAASRREV